MPNTTGMHYTSRENIMKVVSPLFLDDLRAEFEKVKGTPKKLEAFHQRIADIRIFDPACGSGNFLILAYEKLRELEMDILDAKGEVAELFPRININRFYGIEIDDFAHELAMLALWIKEHQMNLLFHKRFATSPEALPLREGACIAHDNAIRANWKDICPPHKPGASDGKNEAEVYILGNPPYLGARSKDFSNSMKEDRAIALGDISGVNEIDYFACWLFKARDYIDGINCVAGFVSTNSICQGEQAALIWHPLLAENSGIELSFAHRSFKWTNSAVGNAGVTCVVTAIRNKSKDSRFIFENETQSKVTQINAYLTELPHVWVWDQTTSISNLPKITMGSMPNDGGFLLLSKEEKDELCEKQKSAHNLIKKFKGADEFLYKRDKFCLWIDDENLADATQIEEVSKRIEKCRDKRAASPRPATNRLAEIAYRFGEIRHKSSDSIIFPRTTSERRDYIPLGFLDDETVISSEGFAIYDAQPWTFGVLSSKMHMAWTKLVAGRLKTDPRYSSFVYNNYPIPSISNQTKEKLEEAVFEIIDIRERFSEMTYADMYDPDKMPDELFQAHRSLDGIVDRCYRSKPFKELNERLETLIALYKKKTSQD